MQTVHCSQTSAPQPIPVPVTETERLLVVGDAAVPTGLARVIQSLLGPLREDFEIHHWGINYRDEPHDYPWTLYPAAMKEGVFDPGPLADLIKTLRPGLLFLVADLWVLGDYLEGLAKRAQKPLGVVLYCPIEAGPVEPRLLRRVAGADRLVLYTDGITEARLVCDCPDDSEDVTEATDSAGYECDNQAATMAGLIGVMRGADVIPERFTHELGPRRWETPFNDSYVNFARDGIAAHHAALG